MQLGRVVGTVVSTQKDEKLEGMKLLLVQATDARGNVQGTTVVAVDSVGAGLHEIVLYASGSSARQTTITQNKPVDTVIMAIVDTVEMGGDVTFSKNS
jgi:microcompartment protein CcmK/EutM